MKNDSSFFDLVMKNEDAKKYLHDADFAHELCYALMARCWRLAGAPAGDPERPPLCAFTTRGAATVIKDLRNEICGLNESYTDYYWGDDMDEITPRVYEFMRMLKLHCVTKGPWAGHWA